MKIELYHTTEELKRLFRQEKGSRISTRIRAVYFAQMGKTAPQIANMLGYSRRRIQHWIYAYNKKGLEGPLDSPGRGTGSKLNTDQLQWLRQRIEEGPVPEDGVCVLKGKDIQRIISRQFDVHYSLSAVYKLLHRLGYSYVSSRPEHHKGNPSERETFKKRSVIRSCNSVLIILE